jgi:hypothetical protein
LITTPSKSSSSTPKNKETTSSSVVQANGRSKRSTAGSWLDGPRNSKLEDFMTTRSRIKLNLQTQILLIESQGINITEACMTTANQQVYEDTIQEVNNPQCLFEVNEGKPQTSFANEVTSSSYSQVD